MTRREYYAGVRTSADYAHALALFVPATIDSTPSEDCRMKIAFQRITEPRPVKWYIADSCWRHLNQNRVDDCLCRMFYSMRSERQLAEQLQYNILFRWFVGLHMDDPAWHATTFSKNRQRLIDADIAREFFARVVVHAQSKSLMSSEHFTVDGSMGTIKMTFTISAKLAERFTSRVAARDRSRVLTESLTKPLDSHTVRLARSCAAANVEPAVAQFERDGWAHG